MKYPKFGFSRKAWPCLGLFCALLFSGCASLLNATTAGQGRGYRFELQLLPGYDASLLASTGQEIGADESVLSRPAAARHLSLFVWVKTEQELLELRAKWSIAGIIVESVIPQTNN